MRAYELYIEGRISRDKYIVRKDKNKNRLQRLKERRMTNQPSSQRKNDLCEKADRYIALMEDLGAGKEITKELVDAFIEKIYIHDIHHIEVKFKFDDLMEQMISEEEKDLRPVEKRL